MTETKYDSAARETPLLREARTVWRERSLIGYLVGRNVRDRYSNSVLGVGWSVLNPMLEMAVFWVIFSQRFAPEDVPYIVYLVLGIVLLALFRDTVNGVATTLRNNREIVGKLHVPIEVLAAAAAGAVLVNFALTMLPVTAIILLSGTAISATAPLVVVPVALVVLTAVGIGLALAPFAVTFPDVTELTRIGLLLLGYLSAVFYPLSIVPDRFRELLDWNPLYAAIATFRSMVYEGSIGTIEHLGLLAVVAVAAMAGGVLVYGRHVRAAIAMLG